VDHSFTCKEHYAWPSLVCVHQMSPLANRSLLLIYQLRKDERLSWPYWPTYSEWLSHISGHPSATKWAQDSERIPAKDRCSTAGPRNQQHKRQQVWFWLNKMWKVGADGGKLSEAVTGWTVSRSDALGLMVTKLRVLVTPIAYSGRWHSSTACTDVRSLRSTKQIEIF